MDSSQDVEAGLRRVLALARAEAESLGIDQDAFDIDHAINQWVSGKLRCWWIGGHTLLLYVITKSAWHSKNFPVLHELLLFKYDHTQKNTFKGVLRVLDTLAKHHDVRYISVGNSLTRKPAAVRRLYLQSGYRQAADILIKEVA